jgi:ElaB/YqjD/DUF883 family membrane-anchored ribosome-binding protein
METSVAAKTSVFGLIRDLTSETKTFMRQEVDLAKTEISEKISAMGRNATALAIGGFVAYAGLIVLLIGLGVLIAYAFQNSGMNPFLASFLGLLIIGVVVAIIGGLFIAKALKSFSKEKLAPKRTLQTLRELKHGPEVMDKMEDSEDEKKPTSETLQAQVEGTEQRMGETLDELGRRLSPSHINQQVKQKISAKPYSAGLIAMVAGFFSALLLQRRAHRS